jgi:tetratricopeptide (TPR) repeat protein
VTTDGSLDKRTTDGSLDKRTTVLLGVAAVVVAGGGAFMAVTALEPSKVPQSVWTNIWFDVGFGLVIVALLLAAVVLYQNFGLGVAREALWRDGHRSKLRSPGGVESENVQKQAVRRSAPPKPRGPLDSLDSFYGSLLGELTRKNRRVADVATNRKRLELQINQLTNEENKLKSRKQSTGNGENLDEEVTSRLAATERALGNVSKQYEQAQEDERQEFRDARAFHGRVDTFRTYKEAFRAEYRNTIGSAQSNSVDSSTGLTDEADDDHTVLQDGAVVDLLTLDQTDASEPRDPQGAALSGDIRSHFEHGLALAESGDLERADSEFALVVESTTGQFAAFAYFNRGVLASRMGQAKVATEHYMASLESGQPIAAARSALNLGCMYQAAGDFQQAMGMYRRAIGYDDAVATPRAAFLLGQLHAQKGELSEAWLYYGRASDYEDHPFAEAAKSRYRTLMRSAKECDVLARVLTLAEFPKPDATALVWVGKSSRSDLRGARHIYQRLAQLGDPEYTETAEQALADIRKQRLMKLFKLGGRGSSEVSAA